MGRAVMRAPAFVFLTVSTLGAQDSDGVLAEARDRLLARIPSDPNYVCLATIDRKTLRRERTSLARPSCEKIAADSRNNRSKLTLESADRVHVEVAMKGGHEVYSWPNPSAGFSRSVEEILGGGAMGTGEFASYLTDLFNNREVRFHFVKQDQAFIEFGFRLPEESSHLSIRAGSGWSAAGFNGSLIVDAESLDLKRLIVETGELSKETGMCEISSVADYPAQSPAQSDDVLIPSRVVSRQLMRDSSENERAVTFSDCRRVASRGEPAALARSRIPEGVTLDLELSQPIDTAIAAAGDVIFAKVREFIPGVPAGSIVTGRIMRMEHHPKRFGSPESFLIGLAFDRIEIDGSVSEFHAISLSNSAAKKSPAGPSPSAELRRITTASPGEGIFTFPASSASYVVPAGWTSKWQTASR